VHRLALILNQSKGDSKYKLSIKNEFIIEKTKEVDFYNKSKNKLSFQLRKARCYFLTLSVIVYFSIRFSVVL